MFLHFCSAAPLIADLTLRVRSKVGFYHLAAGLLEMIRGGPSTLGGRPNELFAGSLMGTDSADGTLRNVRTREKLKVK